MKKMLIVILTISLLLLVACGGSTEEEPAAAPSSNETTSNDPAPAPEPEEEIEETEETAVEEAAAEPEEEMEEEMEEEAAAEETEAEESAEEVEEEAAPTEFGDLPMSGTDPDTGLEINPEDVNPGDTFIVRGTIISMNLTPITSPEFLIQAPSERKYRIRTQTLDDTYFMDGSQWKPFEYQIGVGGQATVTLDVTAGPSDVPTADDLVLVMQE